MIEITSMLIIIAFMLVVFGLVLLTMSIQAQSKRIQDQDRRIQDLAEQLPKRHAHHNAVTLENLAALVIGAQASNSEERKILDSLGQIIATWRSDPNYRSKE